jgi:putative ATP-dependent endonuclease of OLD family
LLTIARYNKEEDEFEAATHYAKAYDPEDEQDSRVPRSIRRNFGFLYLRALRTGSRALSLERGSLLDIIMRIQSLQTGIWEHVRRRLQDLEPPIEDGAAKLTPVLRSIEARLAEYIPMAKQGEATRLFVSQLTREHLRKTLSFFLSLSEDQLPVPFQDVGTGTLNILVLALLSFIAELKEENVIFAMEEPEIALPPHTQRRIASYLLNKTTQCFVTSHSPYILECFTPEQIMTLTRNH